MSPKFDVDWPGIRALAVLVGVREAARRAAEPLPENERERFVDRVLQRCHREGWIREKKAAIAAARGHEQALSAKVSNGADAAANALADDNRATKIGLSRGIRKAAETVGKMEGNHVLWNSEDVRRVVSSAAQVHGWDADKGKASVEFKILNAGGNVALTVNERVNE